MIRNARQTRPQLICVLADNSGSMAGPKAQAATDGIREMLMRCQTSGPTELDRTYFRFVLIRFGSKAEVDSRCNMVSVKHIDANSVAVAGDGGGTDIAAALQLAFDGLEKYMREVVQAHPERLKHPIPLVLLFSDGFHNVQGSEEPRRIAERIKSLNIDGDHITVACAGVSTDNSDSPDEALLKAIASPECYVHINNVSVLRAFIADVGSSGSSSPREVAQVIRRLRDQRTSEG